MITVEQMAKVVHEANRAYCETIGDNSQASWEDAPQWQRDSAMTGVNFRLYNIAAPESAQHDSWMKDKAAEGWVYGPVKDAVKKEHPCMVPYDKLPIEQIAKDYLFHGIVAALAIFYSQG